MRKFLPFLIIGLAFFASCSSGENTAERMEKHGNAFVMDYYSEETTPDNLEALLASEISKGNQPVLFFTAAWCGPCRKFKSFLPTPEMNEALKGSTLIVIDTDRDKNAQRLNARYGIRSIPTFIRVDKDGNVQEEMIGGKWGRRPAADQVAKVMKEFVAAG